MCTLKTFFKCESSNPSTSQQIQIELNNGGLEQRVTIKITKKKQV